MSLIIRKSLINSLSLISPAAVMKVSLLISFIFHVIILLVFQNAFPFYENNGDLRTYKVDFIRPPVEDIDNGDSPRDLIEDVEENETPVADSFQDTISLDTKDKRYVSYTSLIKKEIMNQWRYPTEALTHLIEGRLTVLFSIASDGNMTYISITEASGHDVLDKEVIRAINSAVPFPPFSESIIVKRLNIKATFDYRLTSNK
jgi:TonB family protein